MEEEIFGKPVDAEDARWMLRRLSGRTHEVITAVAVVRDGDVRVGVEISAVEMREIAENELEMYVASGEPMDKAGAYAIQGRAAVFVRALRGSYSAVVGLPLLETVQLLARFGVAPAWLRPVRRT